MAGNGIDLIDRAEAAARLPEFGDLLRLALTAQGRARAPYSKFNVGAAVLGGSGATFLGCNVESASYGATICAVLIWKLECPLGTRGQRIIFYCFVVDFGIAWEKGFRTRR